MTRSGVRLSGRAAGLYPVIALCAVCECSGSLPPGFPWTTIGGKHYWDGGLVSNSPLDQVIELGGLTGSSDRAMSGR